MSGEVQRRFAADAAEFIHGIAELAAAVGPEKEVVWDYVEGGLAIEWAGIDCKARKIRVRVGPSDTTRLHPSRQIIQGELA